MPDLSPAEIIDWLWSPSGQFWSLHLRRGAKTAISYTGGVSHSKGIFGEIKENDEGSGCASMRFGGMPHHVRAPEYI